METVKIDKTQKAENVSEADPAAVEKAAQLIFTYSQ